MLDERRTVEQYGLCGFSALYAERLHLPRLAAARQVALWLLQLAPGVDLNPADIGWVPPALAPEQRRRNR